MRSISSISAAAMASPWTCAIIGKMSARQFSHLYGIRRGPVPNYSFSTLKEALLVAEGVLEEGTPAYGIAQRVIHGDPLSPNQRWVFDTYVAPALERRQEELRLLEIASNAARWAEKESGMGTGGEADFAFARGWR
jgi:hypothetical protein